MDTPTRRSVRVRQSVCYSDSPNEEKITNSAQTTRKSKRSNYPDDTDPAPPNVTKTPTAKKSVNPAFSPKKLRITRTPSTAALESLVSENSPANIKIDTPTSSRKSNRVCTPNRRYSNINLKINLKEKSVQLIKDVIPDDNSVCIINSSSDEDEDEDESTDKENVEKPTTLFDELEDVEGQKLYSFKTPKKKDGMALLASNTPKTTKVESVNSSKTPKTPNHRRLSTLMKTPTSSRSTPNMPTKTPTHVRSTIKRSKLTKLLILIIDLII